MKKILKSVIVLALCSVPSCIATMTNPAYVRALQNYNCVKGYSPCVHNIQVEVVHVYEDN